MCYVLHNVESLMKELTKQLNVNGSEVLRTDIDFLSRRQGLCINERGILQKSTVNI